MADAPKGCSAYAAVAWRYLNAFGYINFGVSPELIRHSLAVPAVNGHVIVIGAGLAGIVGAGQPRLHPLHVQREWFAGAQSQAVCRPCGRATAAQLWAPRDGAGGAQPPRRSRALPPPRGVHACACTPTVLLISCYAIGI